MLIMGKWFVTNAESRRAARTMMSSMLCRAARQTNKPGTRPTSVTQHGTVQQVKGGRV
jgi:hypothetical protein